jgi:hypothetical protein
MSRTINPFSAYAVTDKANAVAQQAIRITFLLVFIIILLHPAQQAGEPWQAIHGTLLKELSDTCQHKLQALIFILSILQYHCAMPQWSA